MEESEEGYGSEDPPLSAISSVKRDISNIDFDEAVPHTFSSEEE